MRDKGIVTRCEHRGKRSAPTGKNAGLRGKTKTSLSSPRYPDSLQVDPGLELDVLREKFAFEIVAEQEEGYRHRRISKTSSLLRS